jgi:hypothetical protein
MRRGKIRQPRQISQATMARCASVKGTKSPFDRVGYLGSKEGAAMWMTKRLALLVVAG